MGMLGTIVNVHILDNGTAKAVFGEHSFYNLDEQGVVASLEVLVE